MQGNGMRLVKPYILVLAGLLAACAGERWTGNGVSQNSIDQDLESCYQMAHARAQDEAFKIKSAMRLEPESAQGMLDEAYRQLRKQHYEAAKEQYKNKCMLEKGYGLE